MLSAGQLLFIPQGTSYRVEKVSAGESRYVLLNFTGSLERALPKRYSTDGFFRQEQAGYARLKRLVEYLQEHMFDAQLKIAQLPLLCGMSDTYFRTLFQAGFGMNPQEYVTNKRLSRAAAILDSGVFDSVSEVARAAGYTAPLYFSRVFTRHFFASPSAYARIRK